MNVVHLSHLVDGILENQNSFNRNEMGHPITEPERKLPSTNSRYVANKRAMIIANRRKEYENRNSIPGGPLQNEINNRQNTGRIYERNINPPINEAAMDHSNLNAYSKDPMPIISRSVVDANVILYITNSQFQ